MVSHHAVFSKFDWRRPVSNRRFCIDGLGSRTRREWLEGIVANAPDFVATKVMPARKCVATEAVPARKGDFENATEKVYPELNEEYFEWVDILEAVDEHVTTKPDLPFVFLEAGAGYGRWSAIAAAALRSRIGSAPLMLIVVEPDPIHLKFLRRHLADNGLLKHAVVYDKALTADGRKVHFHTRSKTQNWFGTAVVDDSYAENLRAAPEWQDRNNAYVGKPSLLDRLLGKGRDKRYIVEMDSIRLSTLIDSAPGWIDFVDMDIQGAEGEVIDAAIEDIDTRVGRVHVGTHSTENERRTRQAFEQAGWERAWDFECLGTRDTPFGRVSFGDGVLSYSNPKRPWRVRP